MNSTRPTLPISAFVLFANAALVLLLAACGAMPEADRDPDPRNEPVRLERVVGVVNRVDAGNRSIEVTADRDSRVAPGRRITIYYDDLTTVEFEGREFRPEDLEPGDRIVADVQGDRSFLEARTVVVTEDSSPDNGPVLGTDDRLVAGTLRRIDTGDRTLTVATDSRARDAVVRFDSRTRVFYGDRSIAISELREFDEIEIELVPGARYELADTVTVVNSGQATRSDVDSGTARGEVVVVDESRRELVITTDNAFLSSHEGRDSFDTRSSFDTRKDERATFRYDPNVIVEYQGDYYGPSNLERGDGVEIDYEREGGELWAKRIFVTASVRH